MKRNLVFTIIFLLVATFNHVALAELPVPPGPATNQYDAAPLPPAPSQNSESYKVVKVERRWTGVGSWFRKLTNKIQEDRKVEQGIEDSRYRDLKDTERRQYEALRDDIKNSHDNLQRGIIESKNHASLCANEVINTVVTWGIILLVVLAVAALVGYLLRRKSHSNMADQNRSIHCVMGDHETESVRRANETSTAIAALATQVAAGFTDMRGGFEGVRQDIQAVPEAVAKNNELQRAFPLDINGRHFVVHPRLIVGRVRTLLVASTATDEEHYAGHDEIPRVEAKSSSHLKGTNARVLKAFLDGAYDDDSKPGNALQRRVCKHALDADGGHEIVEQK